MTDDQSDPRDRRDRLIQKLAEDVDQLSEEELRAEFAEECGDVDSALRSMRTTVEAGIKEGGRRRLAAARQALEQKHGEVAPGVLNLPVDQKRALVERFADNDEDVSTKLTLAARNQHDFESDLDTLLEDLIDLGEIDEDGNPL